jgi:hypothetical protein
LIRSPWPGAVVTPLASCAFAHGSLYHRALRTRRLTTIPKKFLGKQFQRWSYLDGTRPPLKGSRLAPAASEPSLGVQPEGPAPPAPRAPLPPFRLLGPRTSESGAGPTQPSVLVALGYRGGTCGFGPGESAEGHSQRQDSQPENYPQADEPP